MNINWSLLISVSTGIASFLIIAISRAISLSANPFKGMKLSSLFKPSIEGAYGVVSEENIQKLIKDK